MKVWIAPSAASLQLVCYAHFFSLNLITCRRALVIYYILELPVKATLIFITLNGVYTISLDGQAGLARNVVLGVVAIDSDSTQRRKRIKRLDVTDEYILDQIWKATYSMMKDEGFANCHLELGYPCFNFIILRFDHPRGCGPNMREALRRRLIRSPCCRSVSVKPESWTN